MDLTKANTSTQFEGDVENVIGCCSLQPTCSDHLRVVTTTLLVCLRICFQFPPDLPFVYALRVEILTLETIKLLQYETPDFVDPDLPSRPLPYTPSPFNSFVVLLQYSRRLKQRDSLPLIAARGAGDRNSASVVQGQSSGRDSLGDEVPRS